MAAFQVITEVMVKAALRDRTRKFTPIPLTQSRLEVLMSAMAEKQLMMLKLVDQTPVLAGCSGCNLKFFVPKGLMKDPFQANNYLLSKFDRHVCMGEGPRTGGTQSSTLRTSGDVPRGCAQEEG
jgi:hypothetical protein